MVCMYSQDIDSLERQISDDLNQGKSPLFIMAYAGTTYPTHHSLTHSSHSSGTPLAGHIDDISS